MMANEKENFDLVVTADGIEKKWFLQHCYLGNFLHVVQKVKIEQLRRRGEKYAYKGVRVILLLES